MAYKLCASCYLWKICSERQIQFELSFLCSLMTKNTSSCPIASLVMDGLEIWGKRDQLTVRHIAYRMTLVVKMGKIKAGE